MDAQTFAAILKNRDRLFEIPWEQLKALSQEHPCSPHVWLLMLEKARLEQRPDFEQLLEHTASRTFDRAFLYRYLRHLQTQAPGEEHFQLAEDYLELKDLSELEQPEAATQPAAPETEREMAATSPPEVPEPAPADEEPEADLDDGERFASLEEVFQFPADLPLPKAPEAEPDATAKEEPAESEEPAAAPDEQKAMRGKVLSLDDLLAELPEEVIEELEEKGDADESPAKAPEPAEPVPEPTPAPPDAAADTQHQPPGSPIDYAAHGELAAAGVITARHMAKWLGGTATRPKRHAVPFELRTADPVPRPAPLKRHQLESWQKLLHAPPRHLFIAPDSEVEKPVLRHHSRPDEKKKKKKSLPEPERIARQSLQTPADVVSEPLAQVLEKQGHYEQAIIMYERLRLKYPEKSNFFAAKIEALKKKL